MKMNFKLNKGKFKYLAIMLLALSALLMMAGVAGASFYESTFTYDPGTNTLNFYNYISETCEPTVCRAQSVYSLAQLYADGIQIWEGLAYDGAPQDDLYFADVSHSIPYDPSKTYTADVSVQILYTDPGHPDYIYTDNYTVTYVP